MKKSELEAIRGNLSKVVEPYSPSRKEKTKSLISAYDDGSALYSKEAEEAALSRTMTMTPTMTSTPPEGKLKPIAVNNSPRPRPAPGTSPAAPNIAAGNTAPARDFNKRANSLEREALPAGLFPGSSKKLYDALYYRTRGAIQPRSTLQASKRDLMNWSGLRNRKTIEAQMKYLISTGLVHRTSRNGDKNGMFYEVRLPEEIGLKEMAATMTMTMTSTGIDHDHDQKMGPDHDHFLGGPGQGQTIKKEEFSQPPNTSSKTTTKIDDEAFAQFNLVFKDLTRKLTGKQVSAADAARWRELAEVICSEAERASSHTTVSNLPAFLTEHLRRRLSKEDKPLKAVKKDEVGKRGAGSVQPMTDQEREEVIQMIIEMISSGSYTLGQAEEQFGAGLRPEDWQSIKFKIEQGEAIK